MKTGDGAERFQQGMTVSVRFPRNQAKKAATEEDQVFSGHSVLSFVTGLTVGLV